MEKYAEYTHEVISVSVRMLLESGELLLYPVILLTRDLQLIHSASGSLVFSKYSLFYVLTDKSTVKWIVYTFPCKTVHLIKTYVQCQRCVTIRLSGHKLYEI